MKIILNKTEPVRKLVAIISEEDRGVYLPGEDAKNTFYISSVGKVSMYGHVSLKDLTKDDQNTPIYEGDSITLQF
jgi:hypothetical protein